MLRAIKLSKIPPVKVFILKQRNLKRERKPKHTFVESEKERESAERQKGPLPAGNDDTHTLALGRSHDHEIGQSL